MASEETRGGPDRRELRTFGISLGVVCLLWAGVLWWRGHLGAIPWLVGAAPILVLLALAAPIVLYPLHRVWMPVAKGIARALTWLLLTLVFYLVFTPYGIVMRVIGRDPLHRRMDRDLETYWVIRPHEPFDPERLRRQY